MRCGLVTSLYRLLCDPVTAGSLRSSLPLSSPFTLPCSLKMGGERGQIDTPLRSSARRGGRTGVEAEETTNGRGDRIHGICLITVSAAFITCRGVREWSV